MRPQPLAYEDFPFWLPFCRRMRSHTPTKHAAPGASVLVLVYEYTLAGASVSLQTLWRPHALTLAYEAFRLPFRGDVLGSENSSCICQHTSACVSTSQHTPAYVRKSQHTAAYVSILQHTSALVSIRQHTSAYVSIRLHTSAYISIHQHTSAYVTSGLRPHAIVA
jgi:hypothetical protein